MMKKTIVLLFLLAISISCKNDDEPEDILYGELIGDWKLEFVRVTGSGETISNGDSFPYRSSGESVDVNASLDISDSPKQFLFSGTYDLELTTSTPQGSSTVLISYDFADSAFNWSRSGENITLVDSQGNEEAYEITRLTDTELYLKTFKFEESDNDGIQTKKSTNTFLQYSRKL